MGRGRLPLDPVSRDTKTVSFHVTREMYGRLYDLSAKQRLGRSEYIRSLIQKAINEDEAGESR